MAASSMMGIQIYQIIYLALSLLWLAMCVLGIVAFVRVRRASLLIQALGAGILFLNRPIGILLPFLISRMGPSGSWTYSLFTVINLVVYAPGMIILAVGFAMEMVYLMRNAKPAQGFPVEYR